MTVEKIAEICHETNRAYCSSIGDTSQVPWNEAPEWQKQSAIKGVQYHIDNPRALPQDSHNSWLAEKQEQGWKYGAVKDADKKEHPCYVPYNELPIEQQIKDYLFGAISGTLISISGLRTKLTRGEEIMSVKFNPGGNQSVDRIKAMCAELWDMFEVESRIHYTKLVRDGDGTINNSMADCARNMAVAKTNLETSQMFAVKSVTR